MDKIDFVIPWVDGDDPVWRKQKAFYSGDLTHGNEENRYREWDQLKYWFRGVEKFAPWVNKIHFITCGHLPSWLNANHPKLHFVRHEDYIPNEYLPTFSANPIELNVHRIEGLSEKFVYFNDDIFIVNHIAPDFFFKGDTPRSTAGLAIIGQVETEYAGILHECHSLINRCFNSKKVIQQHFFKFVHPRYGFKRNLLTLLLLPYCSRFFPGFFVAHGPNAYLKSTFNEVWQAEHSKLSETCTHKFRTPFDVSQNVFLWWQWCNGLVSPQSASKSLKFLTVLAPDEEIVYTLKSQKTPIVIINDSILDNFDHKKSVINEAFDSILGEKCSFEL